MDKVKKEHEEKVKKALDKVRPYLQADGGDIKMIEITGDLVVKVEMTGACDGCPYSLHTLRAGVEEAIRKELPEIKGVVAVNM
ncbi:MAG: NifU family protein [Bacteroidota bacterium]